MTKSAQIGSTIKAFDLYGRGWLGRGPSSITDSLDLGCVEILNNSGKSLVESYVLVCNSQYWFLRVDSQSGHGYLAAKFAKSHPSGTGLRIGQQVLCDLWLLRSSKRIRFQRLIDCGQLGAGIWGRLQSNFSDRVSKFSGDEWTAPLEVSLIEDGFKVETVRGVMGTTEHMLRL